jgi:cysteine-rich repeat protein
LAVPGSGFLQSYSTRGQRVPPLFTPIRDQTSASKLLGSVDAERGVIRIPRRSDAFRECRDDGTGNALSPGVPCLDDGDCPAGSGCEPALCYAAGVATANECAGDAQCGAGEECGPGLFDLSTRALASGEIPIPGSEYAAEARHPIAIDSLVNTDDFIVTVRSEPLEGGDANADQLPDGADLNGDGDIFDTSVVTVLDKETGSELLLGAGGSVGASVVRSRVHPFSRLSVATEDGVVAWATPEASEGETDGNADDDVFDYILSIRRRPLSGSGPPELVAEGHAVDPTLLVAGQSLVVSDGLVFWREPEIDNAQLVFAQQDVSDSGVPSGTDNQFLDVTPDGRHVLFFAQVGSALGGVGIYVHDRDTDTDGIPDEPGSIRTSFIRADIANGKLSADGRWIFFNAKTTPQASTANFYVHDRDSDLDEIYDEAGATALTQVNVLEDGTSVFVFPSETELEISRNGRLLAFKSFRDFTTGGFTTWGQFYVQDRDADEDGIYDGEGNGIDPGEIAIWRIQNGGSIPNNTTTDPMREIALSEDGNWIAFTSNSSNLGQPDSNTAVDVFVTQAQPGAPIVRVDRADGAVFPGGTANGPLTLSRDGRYLLFHALALSGAEGCCPPGTNPFLRYPILRDRDPDGNGDFDEGPGRVANVPVLGSGFGAQVGHLGPEGRFVNLTDELQVAARFDLETGIAGPISGITPTLFSTGGVGGLGPNLLFSTDPGDEGAVAVLPDPRPSATPGADLNGDGTLQDTVLRVVDARTALSLHVANPTVLGPAAKVAIADGNAAFLAPDGGIRLWTNRSPAAPSALPGGPAVDVAMSSDVLAVVDGPSTEVLYTDVGNPFGFTALGVAGAHGLQVAGPLIGFLAADLVYVYDTSTDTWLIGPGAISPYFADDFVLGPQAVAFRVPESFAPATDLNGDGDTVDRVLHVLDVDGLEVFNTELAAIPCPTEACNPARPYKVAGQTVRFLTLEPEQAGSTVGCASAGPICDIDGNGLGTDLVLQTFRLASVQAGLSCGEATDVVGATAVGVCTDSGEACADDSQCVAGTCHLPPGQCLRDLATFCDPIDQDPSCNPGDLCLTVSPAVGSCHAIEGPCGDDVQCTAPAFCDEFGTDVLRVLSAVEGAGGAGDEVYLGAGKCLAITGSGGCSVNDDCATGEICDGATCRAVDDTCRSDADCGDGFSCNRKAIIAGSGDRDGDGVTTAIDSCPNVPNPAQLDADADGIGDACDLETCGDGAQTYTESCDDGNLVGGDGCDDSCQIEAGFGPACNNGLDDDGDGLVDAAGDPGCSSTSDTSERDAGLPCDDGVDNDGDLQIDFPGDPGCFDASWATESPECDDVIDNDGDGGRDTDGTPPDADCGAAPWHDDEAIPVPEPGSTAMLGAGVGMLAWLSRRRRRQPSQH